MIKDKTKGKVTLKATKVRVNGKKLKKIQLGVRYTCQGVSGPASSKSVKLKGSGSIATTAAYGKKLKSALKKL